MKNTGEEFLNRLYQDMHMSDIVKRTSLPNDNPTKKIKKYLERLERVHNRANKHKTNNGIQLLKKYYYDKYVIKPENILDGYYRVLDQQYFNQHGTYMNEQQRQELIRTIIKNQQSSLEVWIDYLSGEGAQFYPTWAKYWVFQGMLNIGNYDSKTNTYKRRTKNTVAPFIDLNAEVMAKIIDMVQKNINQDKIEDNLKKLVDNGNFQKLYTVLLQEERSRILNNDDTDGIWIKYNMGDDYKPLWESLQGKHTGWCTAGEYTCKRQLKNGDFYVYYTYDKNHKATNPRIAIRMDGTYKINEIRGIAENQNIEKNFEKILEQKLEQFSDKEKYQKRVHDSEMLTYIYTKFQNKIQLTKEDWLFVYGDVEYFGYQSDSRLVELRKNFSKNASPELQDDKEFILQLVQQNVSVLPYINPRFWRNKKVIMAALEQDVHSLEYASSELTNDKEVMMLSVLKKGYTLRYASLKLRNDKEVVMTAVQQDAYALEYASPKLQNDKEVVMTAVEQSTEALQYASPELQKDKEILNIIIQKDATDSSHFDDFLQFDLDTNLSVSSNKHCL